MQIHDDIRHTLETALRNGGRMHVHRSGGGLRVVSVRDRCRVSIAYGEHAYLHEALRIAAEDYRAGGREYSAVYGPIESPYVTGSSSAADAVDALVLRGTCLDAYWANDEFVCDLEGLHYYEVPEAISTRALAGETVQWTCDRGVTREAGPFQFPSGAFGYAVRVVSHPATMKWHRADMWDARRRGTGPTLQAAVDAALRAPIEDLSAPPARESAAG